MTRESHSRPDTTLNLHVDAMLDKQAVREIRVGPASMPRKLCIQPSHELLHSIVLEQSRKYDGSLSPPLLAAEIAKAKKKNKPRPRGVGQWNPLLSCATLLLWNASDLGRSTAAFVASAPDRRPSSRPPRARDVACATSPPAALTGARRPFWPFARTPRCAKLSSASWYEPSRCVRRLAARRVAELVLPSFFLPVYSLPYTLSAGRAIHGRAVEVRRR